MENQLIEGLIGAMRESVPKDQNLASALSEALSLSKEAAYRRLRGDIMFSFGEVAKLSRRFGFSLDKIVGSSLVMDNNKWALADIDSFSAGAEHPEQYAHRLQLLSEILRKTGRSGGTLSIAANDLPYHLLWPHKGLALFRHYKKAYLARGLDPEFRFSDFAAASGTLHAQKELFELYYAIRHHQLILGRDVFDSPARDILYFYRRQLISESELAQLKQELLHLLADMEKISATGKFESGAEISIYLLDVDLDTAYVHLEADDQEYLLQCYYFVDYLSFQNPRLCRTHKEWIESLKRYATHITKTGEMQRVAFFREQRELIQAM